MTFRGTFLSNFWPVEIRWENITYPSVEHAYVAAKTDDKNVRYFVSSINTPGKAKRFGRQLILRDDWEDVKLNCMREILALKFAHPDLMQKLKDTAPEYLQELNDWGDTFWGVVSVNGELVGENWLGRLLMEIRDD